MNNIVNVATNILTIFDNAQFELIFINLFLLSTNGFKELVITSFEHHSGHGK